MAKTLLRWAVVSCTALSLIATAAPTRAAVRVPAVTRVVVHATPATALAGSLVVLTGSVTPRVSGAPVLVQRLVGKAWHTVSHQKVSATGTVLVSLRAPRKTGAWTLRVTRAGTTSAKPGVSGVLHLRVVSKAFAVTATTPATATVGTAAAITGTVTRKGVGSVWLQQLIGKTWKNVASAKLTARSTFTAHALLPLGAHRLRVAKAFSLTIAGGVSKAFSLTVVVPVIPGPTVTVVALPAAMALRPYTATLTAGGGTAPYTWSATGLPSGLTLAASGALTGTPALAASSSVVVTVRDTGGRTGSATLALTVSRTAGTAWAWGANDSGQLGNGSTTSTSAPTPITGLTDAVQVVGQGTSGGYAVRSNGTVASWGVNTYGALGDGTVNNSTVPVAVVGLTSVTSVAAGIFMGSALKSDGTVWSWGYGGSDQLGNGTTTNALAPVQASNLTGVTAIASEGAATYALRSDGTVWAWGQGANGGLGNGGTANSAIPVQVSVLTGVTAIAGGASGGYALKSDHTVWAWGWNAYGQLGDNDLISQSVPVQVQNLAGVTAIGAGFYAGMALRSDGTVWDWGFNQYGALGNNSVVNSSVPVAVSGLATVTAIGGGGQSGYAIKADGTAWAWGHNNLGELGNGTLTDSSIPVPVSALRGLFTIEAGNASAFAINLG
ncbi:hypothetical protein acdb102_39940 [Acidothermaceae bacterium B102]|nr:hypothetical protein acdb102_39940 [Acidothermaceae bacterium B102]